MSTRYFGASVPRREDPRLLRGQARYVDDIKLPGLLHATIVRSMHAHARIPAVQVEAARLMPGVVGVFGFADLARWMQPIPPFGEAPPPLDTRIGLSTLETPRYPLARDKVRYVGEPIASVVARSRAQAEDAAEQVEVSYEPLAAVVDTEAAVDPEAPRLFEALDSNVVLSFTHTVGNAEAAIQAADVVVRERFRVHRYTGTPLEGRGIVVEPHPVEPRLTMWDSTQLPHVVQSAL
ncbi:MAG: molybdopterin cofactor-binding domain-containing protein, partial [Candidatus Tectomicrobia bacterium]